MQNSILSRSTPCNLSTQAQTAARVGNAELAKKYRRISYGCSFAAIISLVAAILTVVIVIIVAATENK